MYTREIHYAITRIVFEFPTFSNYRISIPFLFFIMFLTIAHLYVQQSTRKINDYTIISKNLMLYFDYSKITLNTLDPTSVSDVCTYLWCCVASQSRKEGVKSTWGSWILPIVSPEDIAKWNLSMNEGVEIETK